MPYKKRSQPNKEYRRVKKVVSVYLGIFVLFIVFIAGFVWGRFGENKFDGIRNYYQNYLPVSELPEVLDSDMMKLVWNHISTSYVHRDDIDTKKMYYGAIKGFVSGLGDPYTVFFDPQVTKEFEEDISGEFPGIGAEIGIKDDRLTIVTPLPNSPAEKAGLLAGDKVYAIDGVDTTDITIEKAVKLIRGPIDTTVTLLVASGDSSARDVVITRGIVELPNLTYEMRDDGLMYVYMAHFYQGLNDEFNKVIVELKKNNAKGLILDLRNNPGGLLDQANKITSEWLTPGLPLVHERFGDGRMQTFDARGNHDLVGVPTVVLINGGSASASEILAGALKDHGVATIVGETSFGKGSVQELMKLPGDSSLKVTIAEWLTPKETSINKVGIEPDVEVSFTDDDVSAGRDVQLDKAVEILLSK